MTMSNTQCARISASAAGASGKAENARAALLPAAETGSRSPAQAFRLVSHCTKRGSDYDSRCKWVPGAVLHDALAGMAPWGCMRQQ